VLYGVLLEFRGLWIMDSTYMHKGDRGTEGGSISIAFSFCGFGSILSLLCSAGSFWCFTGSLLLLIDLV
jgi:hypothetical protein